MRAEGVTSMELSLFRAIELTPVTVHLERVLYRLQHRWKRGTCLRSMDKNVKYKEEILKIIIFMKRKFRRYACIFTGNIVT